MINPMKMLVVLSLTLFTFCLSHQDTYAESAPSTITFDNQSGEFAIVKLMGPTKVAVEVPNGQEQTVHVEAGDYYLLGRYGTRPEEYKYTKGDPFTVTQSGRQYSVITITLHKVVDGNYHAKPVSGNEFENAEAASMGDANPSERDVKNEYEGVHPHNILPIVSASRKVRDVVFEDSSKIRLIVQKPNETSTPLPLFEQWLSGAGLDVVTGDHAGVIDSVLKVQVHRWAALGAKYYKSTGFIGSPTTGTGGIRFSGAIFKGNLIFESPPVGKIVKEFEGKVDTLYSIPLGSYQGRSQAPYHEALNKSNLIDKMGEILNEVYGKKAFVGFWLRAAYMQQEGTVKSRARGNIVGLGKEGVVLIMEGLAGALPSSDLSFVKSFGKELLWAIGNRVPANVIEPLIGLLNHDSSSVRLYSKTMLQEFIKEDFGENQILWQEWWNENKEKIWKLEG